MNSASKMQVISVNVGQPRKLFLNGQIVETGIFKDPMEGRVAVRRWNYRGGCSERTWLEEGEVAAGDSISLLHHDEHEVTIADIVRLYREDKYNVELMQRVIAVHALPEEWHEYFGERIEKLSSAHL